MAPTCTAKLVSVAPRRSRFSSSSFPRFRSHPIHTPSPGFHCRVRWSRKNRSPRPSESRAFSASTPSRAAARMTSSSGISRASASVKSPRMAKWMRGSRFPRASTSRCWTSSSTPAALPSRVGTTTRVLASSGIPPSKSRRGRRRGGARRAARRWTTGDGELARGQEQEERHGHLAPEGAVLHAGVGDPRGDQPRGGDGDRRQVEERGVSRRRGVEVPFAKPGRQATSDSSPRLPFPMRWWPTWAARAPGPSTSATSRALSTARRATRTCASPEGSASSSTAWR